MSGRVRLREPGQEGLQAAVPDLHGAGGTQGHGAATNSPFAEWEKTFGDRQLCAAIADRLTFRGTLLQTGTESYRLQATCDERENH
ncbi:ATP-binding protein [Streptomyces sp. NBC_00842]|uniref:ATP-binding protein n=1 Tax=unclassified Streptomyces TaxID=2593676 RepID=UPI00386C3025